MLLNEKRELLEGAEEGIGPKIDDYRKINNHTRWRAVYVPVSKVLIHLQAEKMCRGKGHDHFEKTGYACWQGETDAVLGQSE